MYEKTIRDNVHGDIRFHEVIFFEIIGTPEFQRTRRIMQLGGTSLTYPGATHTRFSHSLGVYHILTIFLENRFFTKIPDNEKRLVLLAGLLHDIGHGPFSHTFEKITQRSHEKYTVDLIENPHGNIAKILKHHQINPQDVTAIILGKYPNKILNLLVSSQLDADRLDYLKRDSYNCGVDYSMTDIRWIIRNVAIKDQKMVFPKKAVHAIESYLLGRYHMFKQVYNHKTSIIFDELLVLWFKRLTALYKEGYDFKNPHIVEVFKFTFENQMIPLDLYLQFDDYLIFHLLNSCLKEEDLILQDLSDRLVNRTRLFKIMEDNPANRRFIENKLRNSSFDNDYYFVSQTLKKQIIYTEKPQKTSKDETIWIETQNKIVPLSEISLFAETMEKVNSSDAEKILLFPKELV